MSQAVFEKLIGSIADDIAAMPLDEDLTLHLNSKWPVGGRSFSELKELCKLGEEEGWLMSREHGGIKFGRVVKPGSSAGLFSVDVVRMEDAKGPHHTHPNGEIGAVMALDGDPNFDGFPEGWYVYGPGTAHHPTVRNGSAYVLYLLPEGAIEFTGQ
jgi:hypothetical protein